jgi:hypothetical protein
MSEPAEVVQPQVPEIRRFSLADLTEQGVWIMGRLLKAYPNQNQRSIIGWLNGVIDNNEFLALYQPNCVCLAERIAADRLSGKMLVREIFVWCENPDNALQTAAATWFYPAMADWAKQQGIDKVVVGERSDVPISAIRDKFGGRLHEVKTMFARV